MSQPRVFFYVQYLEGIGHAVRAGRIAAALAARGADVTLVFGGEPVPGWAPPPPPCSVVYLPPLRAAPESYSRLLTPDGTPADGVYEARRRDRLLAAFDGARPHIVITEGYPLGRWAMEFELGPLLERAAAAGKARPLVLASLRDILQMPKTAEKANRSVEIFERCYDAMLVHGDARLARVEDSFPPARRFLEQVHYTGFIAPAPPGPAPPEAEGVDVIVSGGGGAIAFPVLWAAIKAKPRTALADARWLALAGPRMSDTDFARIARSAEVGGVALERFRAGLPGLMRSARLSVQRAGYNTICDLLVAGCRAVLVPDADHGQREQPMRAERLAALGRAVVAAEAGLTPSRMASAIEAALRQKIETVALALDGAERTAAIVLELLAGNQRRKLGRKNAGRRGE